MTASCCCLLLFWTLFLLCCAEASEESSLKQTILSLQTQLIQNTKEASQQDIENQLAEATFEEAEFMRAKFRRFGFPNERFDNGKSKLEKGDPVWFRLEIPQWWVTGFVWEELEEDGFVKVHVTADNRIYYRVQRGVDVRGVRSEDYNTIWLSEYSRDLGEFARTQQSEAKEDERQRLYQVAIQLDPLNPHPLDNMGIYHLDHGDLEQAVANYEKSIRVQPNWYHTYYNYALLLTGNPQLVQNDTQILDLFVKGFDLNPLFLDTLWHVAEQYGRHGRHDEECYAWRLLRELNRNPSPYGAERPFRQWNRGWEETKKIKHCTDRLRQGEQRRSDEL